ncbi:MAG TPA: CDP-diacylglycerol--glycerol-3-phosphate 3-phosphatidyltransferase [Candidatus Limiplasma sp.]|nr:CDP-diacylglycerol--glycerol-3-phosphate 3-phosphatidyltransferase [Candidatus Limiplasma sp.]
MNLPNKLTLLRVLAIPVIVTFLLLNTPVFRIAAIVLFVLACLTDWLDGHIARKQGIVTVFGKFLDPVADKLLVLSTMITLAGLGQLPAWVCVLVLFRELMVDGLRMIAVQKGVVIAAGKLGKIKTVSQMVLVVTVLLNFQFIMDLRIDWALIAVVVIMTVWSGVDYFRKNRMVFVESYDA